MLFILLLFVPLVSMAGEGKVTRPPALAGKWYPAQPGEILAFLDPLLARPAEPMTRPVRALLVPHAGYPYSGAVAARAYQAVKGHAFRRVILLGPAHRRAVAGLALPGATHFATPLGEIPLDREAMDTLGKNPLVTVDAGAHEAEHSLEIQLPFLQKVLPEGFTLVPLLVGGMEDRGVAAKVAELLRPLLTEETLLVVSGDFTHYGPQYGYLPFSDEQQAPERMRKMDLTTWEKIISRDRQGLLDHLTATRNNACVVQPAMLFMELLPAAAEALLADYATSRAVTGEKENAVGYVAGIFTSSSPFSSQEKSEDLVRLHTLAVKAVTMAVAGEAVSVEAMLAGEEIPPSWQSLRGTFVTLREEGQLRGCIGDVRARVPMIQSLAENAVHAALHDPRFRPVQTGELPKLEVEVSLLSPLQPIASPDEFIPGKHGILLSKGGRQAVFLPEVATEQKWSREETLSHLARKAGLPADGWREGATFQVFTSESYQAPWKAGP